MKMQNADNQKTPLGFFGIIFWHCLAADGGSWKRTQFSARRTDDLRTRRAHCVACASHGQILIATAGVGRFQSAGSPVLPLLPGDSLRISPNEKHWHGAAPEHLFIHMSSQAADGRGQQAAWMEPVGYEEYARAPEMTA